MKISNFVPKTQNKSEDMAYPFASARREVFKKTFLRHVLLHISFTPVGEDENFTDLLASFVSKRFKKEYGKDELKEEVGLISDDKTVGFLFSRDKTVLRLQYPGYKNFEMVLHLLPYLKEYIATMGIKAPLNVSIIKFNELEFKIPNGMPDIDNAMRAIFSDTLLGNTVFNNGDSRCEKDKYFDDEDSNSHIRLTYGFKLDDMDSSKGSLVLKSTITKELLDLDGITDDNLNALNDLLDGAFQWSVKEDVLTNMRQG